MNQRILEFHGIGPPTRTFQDNEADYWVSVPQFDAALDLVCELRSRGDEILLTFDDGNRSDYEIALPRLAARGLGGHVFVLAGRLDWPCSLGTRQIEEMAATGMTIGLHGFDHVSWRDSSDEVLERELVEARTILSDAARKEIADVAIPFGRYDGRVMRRIARGGFRSVYTSDGGRTRGTAWVKPRMSVRRDTSLADLRAMLTGTEPLARRGVRGAKMLVKRWV